jgi:hypothetical protein
VLEVRQRLFQIRQSFRAGISMHTILPGRCHRAGGHVYRMVEQRIRVR